MIPKSLHTITVLVRIAMDAHRTFGWDAFRCIDHAVMVLDLDAKVDGYDLRGKARKQVADLIAKGVR